MDNTDILFQIKNMHKSIVKTMMKNKNIKNYPSPTQIMIINFMIEHMQQDVYQKDIENYLGLSRATVSDVLNTMEKNYIIKRYISSKDTRTKRVFLNELALDKHCEAINHVKKINSIITRDISKEEIKIFVSILNKMKKNLDDTTEL